MKLSEAVKPISYVKAHAAEVIRDVAAQQKTLVITQNGEARAVLQDIRAYERLQEGLALLKILAQSRKSARSGRMVPIDDALRRVRSRIRKGTPKRQVS